MSKPEPCDLVAERVALAEPLAELADHAASCPRCRRLAALPAELGVVRSELDPGVGFTARMTVGAQHALVARRRRRVAAAGATTVAAAGALMFVVTRSPPPPDHAAPAPATATQTPAQRDHDPAPTPADDDVKALVRMARVERSSHLSARWSHITKPLAPYRALVKGITP
jgi:hypothetical protein